MHYSKQRQRAQRRTSRYWYSVYLLYWYKSTNTDAARRLLQEGRLAEEIEILKSKKERSQGISAMAIDNLNRYKNTCFASTKVQILTPEELRSRKLGGLEDENSMLKLKLSSLTDELQNYKQGFVAIEEWKNKCAEMERENWKLKNDIENATCYGRVENNKCAEMEKENCKLKNDVENANSRERVEKNKCAEMEQENGKLKNELDNASRSMGERESDFQQKENEFLSLLKDKEKEIFSLR
jgi:hypothetical protein